MQREGEGNNISATMIRKALGRQNDDALQRCLNSLVVPLALEFFNQRIHTALVSPVIQKKSMESSGSKIEEILTRAYEQARQQTSGAEQMVLDTMMEKIRAELQIHTAQALAEPVLRTGMVDYREASRRKLEEIPGVQLRTISLNRRDTSEEDDFVTATILEDSPPNGHPTRLLSVLLAARNEGRRIGKSVLQLERELEAVEHEGFHVELSICLNHCTDDTLEKALWLKKKIPGRKIHLMEVDEESPHDAGKMMAEKLMLALLWERHRKQTGDEYYIHTADADILYPEKPGGLLSNIIALRENPNLAIVSGTYSTGRPTQGFLALNAIRKDPRILEKNPGLAQAYGGAMTARYEYMMTDLEPPSRSSFDCYMSVAPLLAARHRGTRISDMISDPKKLPVCTNPQWLVEHPEEASLAGFLQRTARDIGWRNDGVGLVFRPAQVDQFQRLRRAYANRITEAINSLPDDPESLFKKVGQRLMKAIREQLQRALDEKTVTMEVFDRERPRGDFDDEQQFCAALTKNPAVLRQITELLREHGMLDEEAIERLNNTAITPKQLVKELEGKIRERRTELERDEYYRNPVLQTFAQVIDRADKMVRLLQDPKSLTQIIQKIMPGATVQDVRQLTDTRGKPGERSLTGNMNVCFFAKIDGKSYFLKFFHPLGVRFLQRVPSREAVYHSLVNERIFGILLGEDHVVKTLAPSHQHSQKEALGPLERDPIGKVAQGILIQEDLSHDWVQLSDFEDLDLTYIDALRLQVRPMADYHAASWGIERNPALMTALENVKEDIRNRDPEEYWAWLQGNNWCMRKLIAHIKQSAEKMLPIFSQVQKALQATDINLNQLAGEIVRDTMIGFARGRRCIAHLDFKMNNIFVNKQDSTQYKIFDFDHINFADPAYEAGQTLYSLLARGLENRWFTDKAGADEVIQTFMESYLQDLEQGLQKRKMSLKPQDREEMKRIMAFFAGATLLSVFTEDHKKRNCTEKDFPLIESICIDLLKVAHNEKGHLLAA